MRVIRRGRPVVVKTPPKFSWTATIAAHGWYQLAPYRFDRAENRLHATWRGVDAAPLGVVLAPGDGVLRATPDRPIGDQAREKLKEVVRYAFALDVDLSGLHRVCRKEPPLRWIARRGYGRLLRGEDVFEDALKTLLTTNCTWAQTRAMVERLVATSGRPAPGSGVRAFPRPEDVLRAGVGKLRDVVRVGYRAEAAAELADRARKDGLLATFQKDPSEARREILAWRGFGPYAASSLLQLWGRNEEVVVDTWAMAQARKHWFQGRACTPAQVRKLYARFGAEAGRVAWFDLNREHFAAVPSPFSAPVDP
jgi:3-methyladenine DNA glycosylase/8-oxoguanine DNA glycosylase